MTAYDEMVAEFNQRADKAVYYKGCKLFEARLEDIEIDEREEVSDRCAKDAFEYDGYTEDFGRLEPEEVYFLIVEYYDYDEADRYLSETEYYENTEAVA